MEREEASRPPRLPPPSRRSQTIRRSLLLAALAAAIVLLAHLLEYQRLLETEGLHLQSLVASQAALIEAVARYDQRAADPGEDPGAQTLSQVRDALKARVGWLGPATEVVLASEDDDQLTFLFRLTRSASLPMERTKLPDNYATPMRRALQGISGVGVFRDYRGTSVLAAYAPLPTLRLGLVVKEDQASIREPVLYRALLLSLATFLLVGGVGFLAFRTWSRLLTRLEDRERRLDFANEVGGVVTFCWDLDAGRLEIDAPGARLLGLDLGASGEGATVPAWIEALVHPSDRRRLHDFAVGARLGEVRPLEFRLQFGPEGWRWVALRSRRDTEHGSAVLLGAFLEIDHTYRGRASAIQGRRVLEGVRRVLETLAGEPDPLQVAPYVMEVAREITGCSGGFLVLLGETAPGEATTYGLRGFLQRTQDDLVHCEVLAAEGPASDLPEPLLALARGECEGPVEDLGSWYPVGDGLEAPELTSAEAIPIRDGDFAMGSLVLLGNFTGASLRESAVPQLSPLVQAIAQVLLAKRDRVRAAQAVDQSKLLEAAIDNLDEVVMMTDPEGRIVYVNPAACQLSGHSREELLGRDARSLGSGTTPTEYFRRMWETLRSGRSWSGRFTNRRKDGSEWLEEATISPVVTNGVTTHFVKVARDLTSQVEFERELRHAQRMDAVATLTAGVAHEFNNLLGIITGYAELTRDELPASAEGPRRDLEQVLTTCDRGADLVAQLLTFSRQREDRPVRFDPRPLLKETFKMLRDATPSRIILELDIGQDISPVLADPASLRQAIVNLCTNAAQSYGDEGGLVRLSLEETPRGVLLSIQDQGEGMEPAVRERAVEPFFTTRKSQNAKGLGLAVVHGIVEDAGGELQIESQPGDGTRVSVLLPASRLAMAEADPAGRPKDVAGRVLLVDDEPALLETLSRRLRAMGLEVECFSDSARVLEALASGDSDFDLLLTDLTMPGPDGRAVARRFRDMRPGVPVVLVTGFGSTASEAPEHQGLFDYILHKPVRRAELEDILQQTLAPTEG